MYIEETLFSLKEVIRESQGGAIIINDNSKDSTVSLIRKFNKHYKLKLKIKSLINNNGAGYAKDYGIKLAKTKYVLVCDSDNLYNSKSIKRLYDFLNSNKNFEAAHFESGYHFYNNNKKKIDHICNWTKLLKNKSFNNIETLLNHKVLLDNFMMSKKSYLNCLGYPTHHGFDTQGLSVNYLLTNSRVAIVKDTFYSHRRFQNSISYYQREAASNRISINLYLTFENLVLYKKDILINFFKNKIFNNKNDLFNLLYLKKNSKKNIITNTFYNWLNCFNNKNYVKCAVLSSNLLKLSNFSDLSIYLFIRSFFYLHNGKDKQNDIKSYELLRNFYEQRDYSSLKNKLFIKIKSLFKQKKYETESFFQKLFK